MWCLHLTLCTLGLLAMCQADTFVQLHVNRPYNDVSEKFVSFAVKPEDLYDALDGKNRKAVTGMAALLGDAYVKFIGDFYFATSAPKRLRNPTKIIWKGFNRWTRAVNWTMIIPVPYAPDEWDSMHTLKILNTSYMVGITDCIWQLGTDFGSSRALDYVQELTTLKLMTDTFSPYVDNWRVMGADISAGSSAEETKKYVDISRDINAAFGWTQPANLLPSASLGSYIYDSDPALKTLQQERLPLWLTLPEEHDMPQSISKRLLGDETTDALRWAQTLGDAASSGFDVVFKRMTLEDFERPNFSFYVTAMFKKVMGSRVFPARPLNLLAPTNKLYTHCANAMSGGLSFMVVNTEEQPTTITIKSQSRLSSSEVWQYVLTKQAGRLRLNNHRLSLNSTLRPLIRPKDASEPLQLITPGMSVGFWVLPSVNLEHCQYTEIEADDANTASSNENDPSRGYSSADRLLQRLIEETAVSRGSIQSTINRQRRFVLDNQEAAAPRTLLSQLLQPLSQAPENVQTATAVKRQVKAGKKSKSHSVGPCQAMNWLRQVMEQSQSVGQRQRRSRRGVSGFGGPFFFNRKGQKTSLTKKITEIRQPERKVNPFFNLAEFNEEEFFKKLDDVPEPPSYMHVPAGDVHLSHIASPDGDASEMQTESEQFTYQKRKPKTRKPLKILQHEDNVEDPYQTAPKKLAIQNFRLLPTELFEALPAPMPKKSLNFGSTLNSLLFPEPFPSKAATGKSQDKLQDAEDVEDNKKQTPANDFFQAQRELGKNFFGHITEQDIPPKDAQKPEVLKQEVTPRLPVKQLSEEKYFNGQSPETLPDPELTRLRRRNEDNLFSAWWDMPALRRRRALPYNYVHMEQLPTNVIDKDDQQELLPLGRYSFYEYKVDMPTATPSVGSNESKIMKISNKKAPTSTRRKVTLSDNIITTVKSKVSKFISFINRHVNEWYNTLSKHLGPEAEKSQHSFNNEGQNAIA